jgi:hydrogenase assembly chaperone HypC/HupF
MCLALPGQIVATNGMQADVLIGETVRTYGLQFEPEAREGDYVLVKTGLVMQVIPEEEAKELMGFFAEMVRLLEEDDGST